MQRLSNDDKLTIFRRCFAGREDAYGTYDPATGRSWSVKEPVTRQVHLDHLCGRRSFGVYLLTGSITRAAVIDFDQNDLNPIVACAQQAEHYGLSGYVERSKRKGYHVWFFFDRPVPAFKLRRVLQMILDDIGAPGTEIFPKQDAIDPNQQLGNFINAPLFGGCVPQGRTVFIDPQHDWRPYIDQWDLLERIVHIKEEQLDELIEINGLNEQRLITPTIHGAEHATTATIYGLPPCAVAMLRNGVTEGQRVACFRLGIHMHRQNVTEDQALVKLRAWAKKNRPTGGKRVITDKEIVEQVGAAYSGRYRSYGCEDPIIARHCQGQCPMLRRQISTAPET